jgi:hypothetical protein
VTDQFCTACGHPLAPGERFCDACGHRVAAPSAEPPVPPTTTPPPTAPYGAAPPGAAPATPPSDRTMWWIAAGLGAVILLVLVAVLVVTLDDDDEPIAVTPVVTTIPPATTTSTSTTTPSTTTTSTTAPPTTSTTSPVPPPFDPGPDPTGFADPYEAVADWAWGTGLDYQGDCAFLDSTADYGIDPWCGTLWEDRGSVEVYRVADFPGGDFGYWVLVGSETGGWVVYEVAEDLTGAPPF